MKKIIVGLLLTWFLIGQQSFGQNIGRVQAGKPLPEGRLEKLHYFQSVSEIALSELKGKPFILDFWTPGCLSCIESMPKLSSYRKQFKDQIEIIMVGEDRLGKDLTGNAEKVFEKFRQRFDLDLPVAYSANIFKTFEVSFVPYVIWVDAAGIVKAVTTSQQISSESIQKFLAGQPIGEIAGKPVLATSIIGDQSKAELPEVLYKSEFSKWKAGTPMETPPFISNIPTHWANIKPGKIRVAGAGLSELFQLAYGDSIPMMPGFYYYGNPKLTKEFARSAYGQYWIRPLLELSDSSILDSDWKQAKNLFSYELSAPVQTTQQLAALMRRDLKSCFGFVAQVEQRSMPCWMLVVKDEEKAASLKNAGATCVMEHSPIAFNLVNVPVYQLIRQIWEYNSGQIPIIDQTGITGHIDVRLEGILTDIDDVRKGLQKYGLALIRSQKQMKVIVIKDK